MSLSLIPENFTTHADPCHPIISSNEGNMNTEQVEDNELGGPIIDCGSRIPSWWSSARSGSVFSHTTKGNTNIYVKSGGRSKANQDFGRVPAEPIPYYNSGSVTYVKRTSSGDVRLYISHSGAQPTLSFARDKIRYQ